MYRKQELVFTSVFALTQRQKLVVGSPASKHRDYLNQDTAVGNALLQYIPLSVVVVAAAAAAAANGAPQLYVVALLVPNDNAPSNILLMKRNDIRRHL